MSRKCRGYCKESGYPYSKILPYNQVFSEKRLLYKKASWCNKCEVSVRPPSVNKIIVTTHGKREEFPDKIKVICPCCMTICRGGPVSKIDPNKSKPKLQQTIYKVGNEATQIDKKVKWVKPDLPESRQLAKDHPSPLGRPKGRGRQKSK